MSSAVIEIQRDALDRSVPVTDLLRKALVVARKLEIDDLQKWVERELNGYPKSPDVPEYRMVTGNVKGWNPFHGWIPVVFESPEEADAASRRAIGQSAAELESILERNDPEGQLHIPLPHRAQRALSESMGFDTNFSLFVSPAAIVRALDAIRNALLNWSLQLEADGILGEGLTFSEKEKKAASEKAYNVNNFYGTVGSAEVQQAGRDAMKVSVSLNLDDVSEFIGRIREVAAQLGFQGAELRELEADLDTVEAQLRSPRPKQGLVRSALSSIKKILEAAGGALATQLAVEAGKKLLGG